MHPTRVLAFRLRSLIPLTCICSQEWPLLFALFAGTASSGRWATSSRATGGTTINTAWRCVSTCRTIGRTSSRLWRMTSRSTDTVSFWVASLIRWNEMTLLVNSKVTGQKGDRSSLVIFFGFKPLGRGKRLGTAERLSLSTIKHMNHNVSSKGASALMVKKLVLHSGTKRSENFVKVISM